MPPDTLAVKRSYSKLVGAALFFLTLAFLACHPSRSTKSETSSLVSPPHDFRLVIGEGGGFAGQWVGYTIDSTGGILSWRGRTAEDDSKPSGRLGRNQIAELWGKIDNAHFFEIDTFGPGNLTQLIIVTANGKTHRALWAKQDATISKRSPIQDLYDVCRSIIERQK
jgi:hypothetical protein